MLCLFILCSLAVALGADNSLIVGGRRATPGQFPYQASLRRNNLHTCGGSIVSTTRILTTASCVQSGLNTLTIVVGTNQLNQGGDIYYPSSLAIHEDYNPTSLINDVAIIRIVGKIVLGPTVQLVSLAFNNNRLGVLTGWGYTSYPGNTPNDLRYIALQTIDVQTCADLHAYSGKPITTGHVCTLAPAGNGACIGDGGSPLVINGAQIGVMSWGIPCANGEPDVYSSVAFYRGWIVSKL